jgi:hypothetical protein
MASKAFQFAEYQPLDIKPYQQPVPSSIPPSAAYLFAPINLGRETRTQLDTITAINNYRRDNVPETRFSKQLVPVNAYPANPREALPTDRAQEGRKEYLSADQAAYSKLATLAVSKRPIMTREVTEDQ